MHFPIAALRGQIKDLFEACIPKEMHLKAFDEGLSKALKYHIVDFVPSQPSDIGEDYEDGNCAVKHFINVYDNFLQFTWMLIYSGMSSYDSAHKIFIAQNYNEAMEALHRLRTATEVYSLALEMLKPNYSTKYMSASRGKIFSLPNPYNHRDDYTDKVNAIMIFGAAYLMLHEYGHFYHEHSESTPANELAADGFAIKALAIWICKQPNLSQCLHSAVLGSVMTMVAAAYINKRLTSTVYPDIDIRSKKLCEIFEKETGAFITSDVYHLLLAEVQRWMKFARIELPVYEHSLSSKGVLCHLLNSTLITYKRQFRI